MRIQIKKYAIREIFYCGLCMKELLKISLCNEKQEKSDTVTELMSHIYMYNTGKGFNSLRLIFPQRPTQHDS